MAKLTRQALKQAIMNYMIERAKAQQSWEGLTVDQISQAVFDRPARVSGCLAECVSEHLLEIEGDHYTLGTPIRMQISQQIGASKESYYRDLDIENVSPDSEDYLIKAAYSAREKVMAKVSGLKIEGVIPMQDGKVGFLAIRNGKMFRAVEDFSEQLQLDYPQLVELIVARIMLGVTGKS